MSDATAQDTAYDLSRVTDWLFLGGSITSPEHMAWLAAQGVTTDINAAREVNDRTLCEQWQLGYYHLLWHDDLQHKSAHEFLHVLGWVRDEEAKLTEMGRPLRLYVHCQMGINRGPLLATFLLAARAGIGADEAWSQIKASRPVAGSFDQPVYREACLRALAEHSRQAR